VRPLLFWIGSLEVRSYAALVSAGVAAGVAYAFARRSRTGLAPFDVLNGLLLIVAAGFASARLSYRVQFGTWGYSVLFGVAGGFAALLVYSRALKRDWRPFADVAAPAIALGMGIGRLGCFLAGCCHGRPTTVPWAVTFTHAFTPVQPPFRGVPLHPTQIYESAAAFAIAAWLHFSSKDAAPAGRTWWRFVLLTAIARLSIDPFRVSHMNAQFLGASPSQWLALAAAAAAAFFLRRPGQK
jgi:phosphatidylglycerol---prolipoprotein diacylglyceryl transferase